MNAALATARILVGALMLMTGIMKLAVPNLRAAFSRQLRSAQLPLHKVTFWLLPFAEVTVGTLLILGVVTRPAAAVVLLTMLGATYVHLVVDDPSFFPLQPTAPIIPIVVIAASAVVLVGGAGTWDIA